MVFVGVAMPVSSGIETEIEMMRRFYREKTKKQFTCSNIGFVIGIEKNR